MRGYSCADDCGEYRRIVGGDDVAEHRSGNGLLVHKPYGKNIKLLELQPEYRYYFSGRPMFREFIGIGAVGGTHDIEWKGKIYDGMNIGLGVTFGYVMPIGKRFNVDFHAGFGAVYYNHKEYFTGDQYDADSAVDGLEKNNASGYYLLPTRIGVSITYIIK